MITTIGHVALRVTDLDRSLDFYCRQLGLRRAFQLDREGEPSPWIVYLQIAPGSFLELFPDATATGRPAESSAGYNHIALLVDDMEAALRDLSARGMQIDGVPDLGLDGNWQYWLTDPDGNRIELMQIMPESLQASADEKAAQSSRIE